MGEPAVSLLSLRRHQRVWLSCAAAQPRMVLDDERQRPLAHAHRARGAAFVARRIQSGDRAGYVPLGLSLPKTSALRSLALCVAPDAVERIDEALPLAEALLVQDPVVQAWRACLERLDDLIAATGVILRVYGSLAWQHMTGTQYVRADSDVDLLVCPRSEEQARACLRILHTASLNSTVRLDGEIQFPDGRAVAWRELYRNADCVLAKSVGAVELVRAEQVWGQGGWGFSC
jgi:phosphoribosyl-dephospho-CoA transferase